MKLIFVTGNADKFSNARTICKKFGVEISQVVADIDEIQGEDSEAIARDKARKAYELVGKPVIITDDSWDIIGLNGFPGAYMKSVSQWLTPQNFMNLMQDVEDRSVLLRQYLVYQDDKESVVFLKEHLGTVAAEPRGKSDNTWLNVVAMDADRGKTLAEAIADGDLDNPERSAKTGDAWEDLLIWLKDRKS